MNELETREKSSSDTNTALAPAMVGSDQSREISRRQASASSSSEEYRSSRRRERKRKERRDKDKRKEKRHSSRKRHRKRRHRDSSDDASDSDGHGSSDDEMPAKKKSKSRHRRKPKKGGEKHCPKDQSKKHKEVKVLSEEDYYSKNNEFSTWLKEDRGLFFSRLSSEEARQLFQAFVKAWNKGELPSVYYQGINSGPRTDHNWRLRKETNAVSGDPSEEKELTRRLEKFERKTFKKMQEDVLDELLPKATGRERLIEKRIINRERAKEREASPDIISEKDLLGGSDDFQARLAKERMRKQKKEMEKSAILGEKLQAAREKEAAAMSQLRAILNDAGGKITIPKRTDS